MTTTYPVHRGPGLRDSQLCLGGPQAWAASHCSAASKLSTFPSHRPQSACPKPLVQLDCLSALPAQEEKNDPSSSWADHCILRLANGVKTDLPVINAEIMSCKCFCNSQCDASLHLFLLFPISEVLEDRRISLNTTQYRQNSSIYPGTLKSTLCPRSSEYSTRVLDTIPSLYKRYHSHILPMSTEPHQLDRTSTAGVNVNQDNGLWGRAPGLQ